MTHTHALLEIPFAQWPKLRDLYATQRTSSSAYYLLQHFIEWKQQNAKLAVQLYSLDGDWQTDGTFVGSDHGAMYGNTLSDSKARLITAFNCLDNRRSYLICGFPERILSAVRQHFFDAGLSEQHIALVETYWYHLEQKLAAQYVVDIPKGYNFRRLTPSFAQMVNAHWPHRGPETIHYIERLIRYNDSVGVFDAVDNLIGWCLILPHGALGMLQVLDTHRRRGLGTCIVRYMSKLLADKNREILAPVVFENTISRTLFEKLGFEIVDKVYWVLKPGQK